MKITSTRLKQIIKEELGNLRRNPNGGTSLSESPDRLIMQYQNDAKGAGMGLLQVGGEMAGSGSTDSAREYADYVIRQATIVVDAMVALEKHNQGGGDLAEDLSADAGKAYGALDGALAQAEAAADELIGIEEYIQDQDVREVAIQSTQALVSALGQTSEAAQKLIGSVDASLQETPEGYEGREARTKSVDPKISNPVTNLGKLIEDALAGAQMAVGDTPRENQRLRARLSEIQDKLQDVLEDMWEL